MTGRKLDGNSLTAQLLVEKIYGPGVMDETDILELMADDVVVTEWSSPGVTTQGKTEFDKVFIQPADGAFTDCSHITLNTLISDDQVLISGIFRARFVGPFLGIEPHGNTVSWEIRDIFRLSDGKISHAWYAQDTLQLAKQLGAITDAQAPW